MVRVGEQADVLRALGQFLDEQGASGIEIKSHEVFLAITWGSRADAGHRAYQEHDLEALRAQARAMRRGGGGASTDSGSLTELMRTLGQQLDRDQIEMNSIYQEPDGFRVSGIRQGRYRTGLCYTSELLETSAERRTARGTGVDVPLVRADPFEQVVLGGPVFTRDNQRLGRLSEVRGRYFRVEPGFLQRPYWLAAETVGSAAADEPVILSINKVDVFERRLKELPKESASSGRVARG